MEFDAFCMAKYPFVITRLIFRAKVSLRSGFATFLGMKNYIIKCIHQCRDTFRKIYLSKQQFDAYNSAKVFVKCFWIMECKIVHFQKDFSPHFHSDILGQVLEFLIFVENVKT